MYLNYLEYKAIIKVQTTFKVFKYLSSPCSRFNFQRTNVIQYATFKWSKIHSWFTHFNVQLQILLIKVKSQDCFNYILYFSKYQVQVSNPKISLQNEQEVYKSLHHTKKKHESKSKTMLNFLSNSSFSSIHFPSSCPRQVSLR
ncbi:unnamed protein product [Vicia faba]|uniref:Uncharacterized protein n=1 Tax=Vicia faba TaxID=3906 RepID=A0AAV0ZD75_VICFA|nr:unnamed protein product [Vicia faba]